MPRSYLLDHLEPDDVLATSRDILLSALMHEQYVPLLLLFADLRQKSLTNQGDKEIFAEEMAVAITKMYSSLSDRIHSDFETRGRICVHLNHEGTFSKLEKDYMKILCTVFNITHDEQLNLDCESVRTALEREGAYVIGDCLSPDQLRLTTQCHLSYGNKSQLFTLDEIGKPDAKVMMVNSWIGRNICNIFGLDSIKVLGFRLQGLQNVRQHPYESFLSCYSIDEYKVCYFNLYNLNGLVIENETLCQSRN